MRTEEPLILSAVEILVTLSADYMVDLRAYFCSDGLAEIVDNASHTHRPLLTPTDAIPVHARAPAPGHRRRPRRGGGGAPSAPGHHGPLPGRGRTVQGVVLRVVCAVPEAAGRPGRPQGRAGPAGAVHAEMVAVHVPPKRRRRQRRGAGRVAAGGPRGAPRRAPDGAVAARVAAGAAHAPGAAGRGAGAGGPAGARAAPGAAARDAAGGRGQRVLERRAGDGGDRDGDGSGISAAGTAPAFEGRSPGGAGAAAGGSVRGIGTGR
ncbi:hypothetical protein IF1G_07467 [Cordyceps javanica]|uniref:Uncharacterized protein n=1 Tax=Cordyceps javanica TaxID=43265 RepID=A0A545UW97_9HYPO|nr:hypothetical protein IF1G_07467 [Cordyceps javanica]